MRKTFQSPQEKKHLSLNKDCRDDYRESDKGSRISIPRAKSRANRSVRRAELKLSELPRKDVKDADTVESIVTADSILRFRKRWKKTRHIPLGDFIAAKLETRSWLEEQTKQERTASPSKNHLE